MEGKDDEDDEERDGGVGEERGEGSGRRGSGTDARQRCGEIRQGDELCSDWKFELAGGDEERTEDADLPAAEGWHNEEGREGRPAREPGGGDDEGGSEDERSRSGSEGLES